MKITFIEPLQGFVMSVLIHLFIFEVYFFAKLLVKGDVFAVKWGRAGPAKWGTTGMGNISLYHK